MNKLLEQLDGFDDQKLQEKKLVFRNYVPRTEKFRDSVVKAGTTVAEVELGVEREVRNALKEFDRQQNEPLTLVPKKHNWDLKRNFNEKAKKLEKETEKAIGKIKKELKGKN